MQFIQIGRVGHSDFIENWNLSIWFWFIFIFYLGSFVLHYGKLLRREHKTLTCFVSSILRLLDTHFVLITLLDKVKDAAG